MAKDKENRNDRGVVFASLTIFIISLIALLLVIIDTSGEVNGFFGNQWVLAIANLFNIGVILLNLIHYVIWYFSNYKRYIGGVDIPKYVLNGGMIFSALNFMFTETITLSSWLFLIALVFNFMLAIVYRFNNEYDGKILMSLKEKLLQVFVQLALIPVSALVMGMTYSLFLIWVPYLLIKKVWIKKIKKPLVEGYRWNTGYEGKYTYTETVSHDVRDASGNKIGSFDTHEKREGYDDGERKWGIFENDLGLIWKMAFFALPLRIFSFVMSIFACFIKNIYISVKCPQIDLSEEKNRYNPDTFFLTDMIYF
ncbi:MAG: hypothetical protein J1F33_01525 [Clostridiales bacterium]|nr:hypothetical protein [Clostridiales bacterium]